jgi:2-iminobutanoate/2-iminopropanoate deaminase
MNRPATFLLAMLLSTAAQAAEYMEKTPFQLSRAFSPGVITSGGTIVWVAGQTATQDSQGNNIANNFEAQVKQVFAQVDGVLKRAGGSLDNVVTMTVFIKESRYGDKFVEMRKDFFKDGNYPGSALITVTNFARPGIEIEIQAVGVIGAWYTLTRIADTNPIWAIASMIAASDPQVVEAARMFKCRMINVLVGCAVGLLVLVVGGSSEWKLPFAMAVAVLVSSYVIQIQTMWRQAPITAAIVIAAGLTHHSKMTGVENGLHKVAEVIFGCLVGLLVSWTMSKVWPVAKRSK